MGGYLAALLRQRTADAVRAIPLRPRRALVCSISLVCALWAFGSALARASGFRQPFISGFSASTIATTQGPNLDQNPYGIVTVPRSVGSLQRGDVLVSNFNDANNTQGTGTTIVQIPRAGTAGRRAPPRCSRKLTPPRRVLAVSGSPRRSRSREAGL